MFKNIGSEAAPYSVNDEKILIVKPNPEFPDTQVILVFIDEKDNQVVEVVAGFAHDDVVAKLNG